MIADHNPFRSKKKNTREITWESLADLELNMCSVDILKLILSGDEYRIKVMMIDGANRRKVQALKSGGFLEETREEGSFPQYTVTKAGIRYIKSAEGI